MRMSRAPATTSAASSVEASSAGTHQGYARKVAGLGGVRLSRPPASHPPQALETRPHHLSGAAQPRSLGCECPPGGGQRPVLVEGLGDAHPRGLSYPLLRRAGGAPTRRVTSTLRTARCGPACRVVWEGSPTEANSRSPYTDCRWRRRSGRGRRRPAGITGTQGEGGSAGCVGNEPLSFRRSLIRVEVPQTVTLTEGSSTQLQLVRNNPTNDRLRPVTCPSSPW